MLSRQKPQNTQQLGTATSKLANPAGLDSLPHQPRGRSTVLPRDIDDLVCRHLQAIRSAGGIINRHITVATANGIIRAPRPSLLVEHGRFFDFSVGWVNSIHHRINFTKRKATKAAKKTAGKSASFAERFPGSHQGHCDQTSSPYRSHHQL